MTPIMFITNGIKRIGTERHSVPLGCAALSLGLALCPWAIAGQHELTVPQVYVQLIEQSELSASTQGVLVELNVKPGDSVIKGQQLAKLDDRQVVVACEQAQVEKQIADKKANDQSEIELSQKLLQQVEQLGKQKTTEDRAAALLAENDLAIKAAMKSAELAQNQLLRARTSRAQFTDSVSEAEIEELKLKVQHAELETQQAEFEHQQNLLKSQASSEALIAHQHAAEQQQVRCEQAKTSLTIAKLDAQLARAALDAAQLQQDKHIVRSPLNGVVAEVDQQPGQWVNSGDRIVRVLRLDRLQVEGFLPIEHVSDALIGAPIRLTVAGFSNQEHEFKGVVTYVSPEVDAVNQEVTVRAEFENASLMARPGMKGAMKIIVEQP